MSATTIKTDRLSPETITALAIDLGVVPEAILIPKAEAVVNEATIEALSAFDGKRVRVHIEGRKMSVAGRLIGCTLHTNWGLELDLSKENVTQVDLKDVDRGRWFAAATF